MKHLGLLPIVGLDISKPAEYIDNRATPNCQNMFINRSVIGKRVGTSSLGSSMSERILAGKEVDISGTSYVVRIGLTKAELLNQGSGTWSDITGSALTATSADRVCTAVPLLSGQRVLVFTNGIDNIRKYTGSGNTADLGGTPPKSKYLIDYMGYLVLAHVIDAGTTYSMRVQWCHTGAIEDWSGANANSKDLIEDGKDITAINIFGNYLTVHKETAIYLGYLVTTSAIIHFDRKNTEVGTVCFATIQNLPTGEQIFLARDGIHTFNGISAPLIPSPIMDEIRESANPAYLHKCWSIVVPELDEYWVAIPIGSQTEPDTIYKYNFRTRQAYKDRRTNISCAFRYQRTSDVSWDDSSGTWGAQTGRWDDITDLSLFPSVAFGNTSGLVTIRDTSVNNDNGTAIDAFWESKDYEDSKGRLARWQTIQIWAKGNTVKVQYSIDKGITWTTIDTISLSSDYPSDDSPIFGYFDVVSSKIRFRFSNAVDGERFDLKQYIIEYTQREWRH